MGKETIRMKLKQISAGKTVKINLGNYQNIDTRIDLTFDVEEGEAVDYDAIWDTVNQQLFAQALETDPSWIKTKEYNDFWKVIFKIKK